MQKEYRCAGMWTVGSRVFNHSRQNTNSALESNHNVVLTRPLSNSCRQGVKRSFQWLLHQVEVLVRY